MIRPVPRFTASALALLLAFLPGTLSAAEADGYGLGPRDKLHIPNDDLRTGFGEVHP